MNPVPSNRWEFAPLWHHVAMATPDRAALVHGAVTVTWRQFDAAAASLATRLRRAGLGHSRIVALCLGNHPGHLVSLAACLRADAIPANVNPRYRTAEMDHLLSRLGPAAVIFDAAAASQITPLASEYPRIRWYQWGTTGAPSTTTLTLAALLATPQPMFPVTASDSMMIKCTGGTTGVPVPVMWCGADLLAILNAANPWLHRDMTRPLDDQPPAVADARLLVASPLAHGSAMTRALGALCAGGAVITVPTSSSDPRAVLDGVQAQRADTLAITGDAHARPLLDTLATAQRQWDLSHLRTITSSGAPWTAPVKEALLDALPHLRLVETFGATEATGLGSSTAERGRVPPTGVFRVGRHARVFTDVGAAARPGDTGRIGVSAPHPAGLHPSGALPSERFLISENGTRYLLSGDHVRLLDHDHFAFLGRSDDVINTGGEKVYAPEVAAVLADCPAVADAAVLAVPDDRLGQTVAALLCLHPGGSTDAAVAYARQRLAGYKIPRVTATVAAIPRTPTGKTDLRRARQLLRQAARS